MKKDLLSYSALSQFEKSPNHLLSYWNNKIEPTPAMLEGSLGHTLILEPEKFDKEYVVFDGRRAGGVWNEFKTEVENEEKPRKIITQKQYNSVVEIVEVALKDPQVREILKELKEVEKHVEWETKGLNFHGYCDGVADGFIVDVKFCQDSGYKFQKDLIYGNIKMQGAMYLESFDYDRDFYIIAIEKKAPFNSQVYKLSAETIKEGRNKFYSLIDDYKEWNGKPQGYSKDIIEI